jgi:hypothetical protein
MTQPNFAQIHASPGPGLRAVLIEAFGSGPCRGNGAAVVRLESPPPAPWMGAIAASLRQSETAFVLPIPAARTWLLRWFTPSTEVRLCGHATLGALLALSHWGISVRSNPCASGRAAASCRYVCCSLDWVNLICQQETWSPAPCRNSFAGYCCSDWAIPQRLTGPRPWATGSPWWLPQRPWPPWPAWPKSSKETTVAGWC